jgi:hypothetical protein
MTAHQMRRNAHLHEKDTLHADACTGPERIVDSDKASGES